MDIYELRNDSWTLSTDPARLDMDVVTGFLARAYWANTRPRQTIEKSIRNSLSFGVYEAGKQIAYCRVVTDYATFAWLCDVFVDEAHRGLGVSKWMMEGVKAHPELQGLRRWLLATRDAHGLYSQYGFAPLATPERWMEIMNG
jgi:GNAT superfamily N-acetyltransferase